MSKAVTWAWRYFTLEARIDDTLEDAVAQAFWAAENGEESLVYIEHEGTRIDEKHPVWLAYGQKQEEEWRRRMKKTPRPTHVIQGYEPVLGHWVNLAGVVEPTSERSQRLRDEWVEVLGEDRVRVEALP